MGKTVTLEELSSYKISLELADLIYRNVKNWQYLDQKTVGVQWIRSTDSISANIAEGFGRYHKKDKIKFFYNARASAFESGHWLKIASQRKILTSTEEKQILTLLQKLPREINYLIKFTNINLSI